MTTSVAEVPMDDRDMPVLFHGRTLDLQDVTVQGVVTWRVADPEILGQRVDFTIDLERGTYHKQPLDQLATLLTGFVQQAAVRYLAEQPVRKVLEAGPGPVQDQIVTGLTRAEIIAEMGIQIIAVRIADVSPTVELENALQTPTREKIQEEADRAVFERRAQAIQEERAIAENELQNQIELAKTEERLIEQRGRNERQRAGEEAQAKLIEQTARAERDRIDAAARAERITAVEGAKVTTDRERMEIYRELPTGVIMGLAARDLAEKIQGIEHLNITPDLLGPVLTELVQAGTKRLGAEKTADS
jgi:regulator of protease activity HflC (stomatin/prohibitin superfamily)